MLVSELRQLLAGLDEDMIVRVADADEYNATEEDTEINDRIVQSVTLAYENIEDDRTCPVFMILVSPT